MSLIPLSLTLPVDCKTLCTCPSTVRIFSSVFLLSVGHLSDHPPERCPEGPGWDELRDPVSVGVQHGPHQSCHCLAHWPGGAAILETQHRDHSEYKELKPRQTTNTAEQFTCGNISFLKLQQLNTQKFDIVQQIVPSVPAITMSSCLSFHNRIPISPSGLSRLSEGVHGGGEEAPLPIMRWGFLPSLLQPQDAGARERLGQRPCQGV